MEQKKVYCNKCRYLSKKWRCVDYATKQMCEYQKWCSAFNDSPYSINQNNDCQGFKKKRWWKFWSNEVI